MVPAHKVTGMRGWRDAHQVCSMVCARLWKAATLVMFVVARSTLAAQYRLFQSVTYWGVLSLAWCTNHCALMSLA